LREHAIRKRPVGRLAPRLRQRAVPRKPFRILEMPERAIREVACVGGELQPSRFPAGVRTDAGDRRAKCTVDGWRFVSRLRDRLQQLDARSRLLRHTW
jgi:hypothetical protein